MIETSKILYCKWCTGTLYFALWLWCFTELTVKKVARPPSLVNFIALPFQSNPNNAFLIFFSISCLPYLSLASDSNHFFPAKCANNTSSPIMHDSEFQLTVFFFTYQIVFKLEWWMIELLSCEGHKMNHGGILHKDIWVPALLACGWRAWLEGSS